MDTTYKSMQLPNGKGNLPDEINVSRRVIKMIVVAFLSETGPY